MSEQSTTFTGEENLVSGELETSKSERHVWLMKCPPLASRSLRLQQQASLSSEDDSSPGSSGPIAKVIVDVDPLLPNNSFSSTKFTMELACTESGNTPKRFSMDMSKDFVPMSVFSEAQGRLSVEGKIHHKFDVKLDDENIEEYGYGKLCRERSNKYMTKTRQIQVIDNDNGMHMRPMPGMVGSKSSGFNDKKKLAAKGSEMKRTRRGSGELEEILFKLFERQANWTLKQLITETNQPEQFLKEMIRTICVYNNKGPNQGTYEIKPEYKRSGEEKIDI